MPAVASSLSALATASAADPQRLIHDLIQLLRLHHLRQRFPTEPPPAPRISYADAIQELKLLHPDQTIGQALQRLEILERDPDASAAADDDHDHGASPPKSKPRFDPESYPSFDPQDPDAP